MGETYEVEVKVAIDSYEEMEERILKLGAKKINREEQIDSYYDHPSRTFHDTDEALRVRSRLAIENEQVDSTRGLVELTYKGPKIDSTTKTRIEASVSLDDSEEMKTILENLSFKLVATVTKKRQFFTLPTMTISIDEVEDVGLFMELESVVKTKEVDAAREEIFSTMKKLGLDPSQSIRASYLELYVNTS
ncbi:MAG: class IV adenylate cyclase [Candidatus Thorarchaeota archaeon]|jgi:adenylate cyclase class 2